MTVMRWLAVIWAALWLVSVPVSAQQNKTQMQSSVATNLPDNVVGAITPSIVRTTLDGIVNSYQQFAGVNAQTGISYIIQLSDYGQLITITNAASVAISLPQATGSFVTFNAFVSNLGAGTATVTPTISTINGASTLVLTQGQSAWIVADPTGNYQTIQSTNGGIAAKTCAASNWVNSFSPITGFGCSQPNFTDLAGSIAGGQIPNGTITNAMISASAAIALSKLATQNADTFVANATGGSAVPTAITGAQAGALLCAPSRSVFTTGTNTAYSTPTCNSALPTRIELEMVGAGGGGAGSGTTPGAAGTGGNTCWNTSGTACSTPLFAANGGALGGASVGFAAGGSTSSCDLGLTGAAGGTATTTTAQPGGMGGSSYFGGAGQAGAAGAGAAASAAQANTGSGGGGAGASATANTGGGGASGGYCRKLITSPASSYVYTIGALGAAGTAGSGGAAGGAGATGVIIATAYWQ